MEAHSVIKGEVVTTVSHRDFMRNLSADDKRFLTEKTDMKGLIRLSVLVTLICALTACIISRVSWWPFLMLPQGLLLISLFHLEHECIHDTPFRTQRLNTTVGAICGFILLLPSEWFRYFHRDHHRYTQIQGKDPELDTAKPASKIQWLIHLSGLPLLKGLLTVIAKTTFGRCDDGYIPDKAKVSVIRQVRSMTLAYSFLGLISLITQSTILLWIWIIPLQIGQPFLRLYLLAEHSLCDHTDNMFLNTRTVLTNPIVRWFTWNMPFHTEHHVYPGVPFHKLPTLHKKMQGFLEHTNSSYTEFNQQLYKTLR